MMPDVSHLGVAGYKIRPATPDDLSIVLRHRRCMFEDMGCKDAAALDRMIETSSPLLQRGLESGFYRGWWVERDGEGIVAGGGLIGLEFHSSPRDFGERRWWIANVYTEPAHRRKQLARWIVGTIVAWSRDAGLTSLYLHASDEGRSLYEAMGFVPTSEMRLTLR
jgi:GNAT superfamily N-acetyltransferase